MDLHPLIYPKLKWIFRRNNDILEAYEQCLYFYDIIEVTK